MQGYIRVSAKGSKVALKWNSPSYHEAGEHEADEHEASAEPSDARAGRGQRPRRPCDPRPCMRRSRIAVAVASLLLLAVYVTPLWRIQLIAPQYPEGLGLRIWVNQITGLKPERPEQHQRAEPLHRHARHRARRRFPSCDFMPKLLAAAIVAGLLVAADRPPGAALPLGRVRSPLAPRPASATSGSGATSTATISIRMPRSRCRG